MPYELFNGACGYHHFKILCSPGYMSKQNAKPFMQNYPAVSFVGGVLHFRFLCPEICQSATVPAESHTVKAPGHVHPLALNAG